MWGCKHRAGEMISTNWDRLADRRTELGWNSHVEKVVYLSKAPQTNPRLQSDVAGIKWLTVSTTLHMMKHHTGSVLRELISGINPNQVLNLSTSQHLRLRLPPMQYWELITYPFTHPPSCASTLSLAQRLMKTFGVHLLLWVTLGWKRRNRCCLAWPNLS